MKNWIKISLVFIGLLAACSDENGLNEGELSPDLARQSLEQMSSQMRQDVIDMVSSDGVDALLDFAGFVEMNDPFAGRQLQQPEDVLNQTIDDIQHLAQAFLPKSKFAHEAASEIIELSAYYGVYEWNAEASMFIKTEEVVDHVAFRFPVQGSQTNNAVFRLLKLEEVKIDMEDGVYVVLPSAILADLNVDDKFCAALNLNVNYSSLGVPETVDVSLFLDPFTYEVKLDWQSDGQVNASFDVKKGNDVLIAAAISGAIGDETNSSVSIELTLNYRNFSIAGTIIASANDDTQDINDLIDISIYEGEDKIGDIAIEIDPNTEEAKIYVVLSDGTKIDLEEILQPAIDELEDIIVALGEG